MPPARTLSWDRMKKLKTTTPHTMLSDKMQLGTLKITLLHKFRYPTQSGNPIILGMTVCWHLISMLCCLSVHEMRLVRCRENEWRVWTEEINAVSPLKMQSPDSRGFYGLCSALQRMAFCNFDLDSCPKLIRSSSTTHACVKRNREQSWRGGRKESVGKHWKEQTKAVFLTCATAAFMRPLNLTLPLNQRAVL